MSTTDENVELSKETYPQNTGITIQMLLPFWSVHSNLKDKLITCQTAAKFLFCPAHSALSAPQFLAKTKKTCPTSPY
jgi:hypothetical protein